MKFSEYLFIVLLNDRLAPKERQGLTHGALLKEDSGTPPRWQIKDQLGESIGTTERRPW
jgi:hypothetical protein